MELAHSIPKRYPRGERPRRQAPCPPCQVAAQDETENKRSCSARQDHGGQGLTALELRPTRTCAMGIALRDRGERQTEGGSSCVA